MAATPSGNGYWMADDDGDVFVAGDATVYGNRASDVDDVAAFAARPQGDGYWMATRTGDDRELRPGPGLPGRERQAVAPDHHPGLDGRRRRAWMAGIDGGVFTFGDAGFFGSMGGKRLNQPIVGMAPTPSGRGYWLVASDGGIFSFGDAGFFGSTGGMHLSAGGRHGRHAERRRLLDGGLRRRDLRLRRRQVLRLHGRHPPQRPGAGHAGPARSAGDDPRPGRQRPARHAQHRPAPRPHPASPDTAGGHPGRRRRHRRLRQRPGDLHGGGHRQAARRHSPRPLTVVSPPATTPTTAARATEFANCYDPTWGRYKARTRPAPGNHEYGTSGAAGYFNYFGPAAGDARPGLVQLRPRRLARHRPQQQLRVGRRLRRRHPPGAVAPGRPGRQRQPAAPLASGTTPGSAPGRSHGNDTEVGPFWDALYDDGADLVLNGHDHVYERFAPQRPDGTADPAYGIREIIVGTGGAQLLRRSASPQPNSQVRTPPPTACSS